MPKNNRRTARLKRLSESITGKKAPRLRKQKHGGALASQWKPGQSGNPAGKPVGTKNKPSTNIKAFFSELLDDPKYLLEMIQAFQARNLHPSIEQMAYYYVHGKPRETVDHNVSFDPLKLLADLERNAGD